MFDRFPKNFHFNYKNIQIEFKNSSRGLYFWTGDKKRLMDLLDIVYIPFSYEGTNEHDLIWSKENIKQLAIRYANSRFKEVLLRN